MKKNIIWSLALGALLFTSCDSYLDKLPDDRTELNSREKVRDLLVSAYPSNSNVMIMEYCTDNVIDNGPQFSAQVSQEELYRFKDVSTEGNDDPRNVWQGFYFAVATANHALEAIDKLEATENLNAEKGEALLCRAYAMFQLANTFCMAWNPEKKDDYLGLPYPTKPGTKLDETYTRGTLGELYEKINNDIETGLPLIDDNNYKSPKFHFNSKAAYAFAARFNLYYMNYDKAIEYATKAIGEDPSGVLRSYKDLVSLGAIDFSNRYILSSEPANLLLVTAYSTAGRMLTYSGMRRFAHSAVVASYETYWAFGPWGGGSTNNALYYKSKMYGSEYQVFFPKLLEQFEFTDKLAQTGFAHIVDPVFTTDETLLVRAEAYAMKNDSVSALKDMNYWVASHCDNYAAQYKVLTMSNLNTFFSELDYAPVVPQTRLERSIKKKLNPQGFTVEAGNQETLIQMILHMRRLETVFQGLRFIDLKRYGISYSHPVTGEDPIVFEPGDLRGAIQLPSVVVNAGLQANPR